MSRLFNSISIPFKKRNAFDLSFTSRITTEFGRLTPIMCEPVLPNDRFRISTKLRVQFAPMVFPVMQKYTAYVHYFFVPNRLLWKHWETFITGGEDGLQTPENNPDCVYPTLKWDADYAAYLKDEGLNPFGPSSLFDYLGFPAVDPENDIAGVSQAGQYIDALPFRAYQLIYNEWYRDQNLTQPIDILESLSGPMSNGYNKMAELMSLRNRAWRKDYFTSALPDPQRGPDVTLPLVGTMDIGLKTGSLDEQIVLSGKAYDRDAQNAPVFDLKFRSGSGDNKYLTVEDVDYVIQPGEKANIYGTFPPSGVASKLQANVNDGDARSATINEVRRAFAIQRWYELAARAGSRYVEQILAHFGIRSSDARLQRPEYIGGSVVPVFIGDVLQTSESTTEGTPLGTPAGVGQAAGSVKPVTRTFEEHGWIIGILSVIPEAAYMQGMPRKFLKRDKFDFAWPLLANLGEQEIQSQELYFDYQQGDDVNMDGFGYAPRYSEYKFGSGQVHGDFRSSLADFHGTRIFDSRPALNQEFIEVDAAKDGNNGLNRIFAVQSGMVDHLWVYMYNEIKVRRCLPKYGTPI